jgi:hypothetical protein
MAVAALCAFAVGAPVGIIMHELRHHALAYFAATGIGAAAGATELIGRYRDKPTAAVTTLPGILYIVINGFVSLAAFWLLLTRQLGPFVTGPTGVPTTMLYTVLLAGFGSMAFFRTSLFSVRVRDTDVAVGPAVVFQVLLRAADRACDRERAGPRAKSVKAIMQGVNFNKAKVQLPFHCLALMQNVSADEASQMNQAVAAIESATLSDEVKSYNLGLLLMLYVGEDVLREGVAVLRNLIAVPGADEPPMLKRAADFSLDDLKVAVEFCLALDPLGRKDLESLRTEAFMFNEVLKTAPEQSTVVLLRLRAAFGPDTLARALELLDARSRTPTPVTLTTQKVSSAMFG